MADAVVAFVPEGTRDPEDPGPDRIEPILRVRCYTAGPNGRLVPAEAPLPVEAPPTAAPDARRRALERLRAETRRTRSSRPPEPTQGDVRPPTPAAPEPITPFPD